MEDEGIAIATRMIGVFGSVTFAISGFGLS